MARNAQKRLQCNPDNPEHAPAVRCARRCRLPPVNPHLQELIGLLDDAAATVAATIEALDNRSQQNR